jgi:hypothetical protein
MSGRVNQPKVFLSHSSLDKPFIERVAKDLSKYKINYWLDTEEIRDGRPWLKVIFEDGLATCDAVLVYLTENSLKSKMVEKEMDATLVEQLGESNISVLPYVSKAALRGRLRPDIRSLQIREWNEENYSEKLPSIVAEIWHSYLERVVSTTTLLEKNRRLELELELKDLRERYEGTVFTPSEEREFDHIRRKLDRDIELKAETSEQSEGGKSAARIKKEIYRTNLLSAVSFYVNEGYNVFNRRSLATVVIDEINKRLSQTNSSVLSRVTDNDAIKENLSLELQTYGLAQFTEVRNYSPSDITCSLIDKMYRFRYWLDYYNHTPELRFEIISTVEEITEPHPAAPSRDPQSMILSLSREIDRQLKYIDYYETWRTTELGVLAAREEFETLCNELASTVEESNACSEKFKVKFSRKGENKCVLSGLGHSLIVEWICPHADTLDDSVLLVNGYRIDTEEGQQPDAEADRFTISSYRIELSKDLKVRWRGEGSKPFYYTTDLAASLLITLLEALRDRVVYNKV